ALVNYLQVVAVEVADVSRVVARPEVGPRFWSAFALSACFDGGSIGGVDLGVVIGDDPEIEAGLTRLALAEPAAGADGVARTVGGVTEPVKVGNTRRASGRVVVAQLAPPQRLQGCRIERERAGDIGHRDVNVVNHGRPYLSYLAGRARRASSS